MSQKRYSLIYEQYLLPFGKIDWAVDDTPSSSRQVELVGQAFLALNLVKLLQNYSNESFANESETNKRLIERGIELVEDIQRGGTYLSHEGLNLMPPVSLDIAEHIEARGRLDLPETCRSVLHLLRDMLDIEAGSVEMDAKRLILAQDLFEEIHTGILGQLEELRTR